MPPWCPPRPPCENEAVVVRLGDGRFAAELDAVAEVGRVPVGHPHPGRSRLAGRRGQLAWPAAAGAGPAPAARGARCDRLGSAARLFVLRLDGVSAGIVVDSVEGTGVLDAAVEEFPAALADRGSFLLAGQVPSAGRARSRCSTSRRSCACASSCRGRAEPAEIAHRSQRQPLQPRGQPPDDLR